MNTNNKVSIEGKWQFFQRNEPVRDTGYTRCPLHMRTLSKELEPPFLPASQAPQGRAVVVSQQPRVPFSPTPDILLADMESPSRVEHGEQVRRQTVAPNATY